MMKEGQAEALNNDDVDMEIISKIIMRIIDQRGNQAKVDPRVNSPVTYSKTHMLRLRLLICLKQVKVFCLCISA